MINACPLDRHLTAGYACPRGGSANFEDSGVPEALASLARFAMNRRRANEWAFSPDSSRDTNFFDSSPVVRATRGTDVKSLCRRHQSLPTAGEKAGRPLRRGLQDIGGLLADHDRGCVGVAR